MANQVTNKGRFLLGTGQLNFNSTALVIIGLLTSTGYTPNRDHDFVDDGTTDDPKSYEIAPSGYTRQTLAGKSVTEDDTNDMAYVDATDPVFSALASGATIGRMVLYRYSTSGGTTSDTGQHIISAYELTATPTNGGDVTIAFAATTAGAMLKIGTTD